MMGKQERIDNQMQLLILDLDSMIPENHLLRQIKNFYLLYFNITHPFLCSPLLLPLSSIVYSSPVV